MKPRSDFELPSKLPTGLNQKMGWIGLVGLSIVMPVVGYQWFAQQPATVSENGGETPVSKSSHRVMALGRLIPSNGVTYVGGPVGEVVGRIKVKEGDWVKQGDVVAYLRTYPERQVELAVSQQQLQAARAKLRAETELEEAQDRARRQDVERLPVEQTSDIAAQQALVASLRSQRDFAAEESERYQMLVKAGAISLNAARQRQSALIQANEELRQTEAKLKQLIASRQRELSNARVQIETNRASAQRNLQQAKSEIEVAEQNLYLAKARLAATEIRAPIAGEVLRVITKSGENLGDMTRPGRTAILALGDTRKMHVVVEVHESNIQQIRIGQVATVRSRNQAFTSGINGKVISIGREIFKNNVLNDDPAALADARVVEVKIQLDRSEAVQGLTNLQVDVEINTQPPSPQPEPVESHQPKQSHRFKKSGSITQTVGRSAQFTQPPHLPTSAGATVPPPERINLIEILRDTISHTHSLSQL